MEVIGRKIVYLELGNGRIPFKEWIDSLRDRRLVAAIKIRLAQVKNGNFGDRKYIGDGVHELRIHKSPGIRIYYANQEGHIVILLVGGSKSTQFRDIRRAKKYWKDLKNEKKSKMRLVSYEKDLYERLQDLEFAALYLEEAIALNDKSTFLLAIKDVVEAHGGIGALSEHVDIKRPSLYQILSENGNPTLYTLQEILKPLGLRLSVSAISGGRCLIVSN